jgi:hypothetical protein
MNFTFKTEHPKGRYRSFDFDRHAIKLNKKEVGLIEDRTFTIRLAILKDNLNEDKNPNCPWKWVSLKKESKSLDEAKKFLKDNYLIIINKYKLYYLD